MVAPAKVITSVSQIEDFFNEVEDYFNSLDQFFDKFFLKSIFTEKYPTSTKFPFYNAYVEFNEDDNPQKLVMEFAVAGFSKDELKVEIVEDTLIVSGEKKKDEEKHLKRKYYQRGITTQNFQIKFTKLLDGKMDTENTNVTFENGILKIEIPFKQETIKKRKLEIKSE